jgi:hypothetical protein
MFRPLKQLEAKWNASTPVWLHNGTKENFFAQIGATAVLLCVFIAKDKWDETRERKRLQEAPDVQN